MVRSGAPNLWLISRHGAAHELNHANIYAVVLPARLTTELVQHLAKGNIVTVKSHRSFRSGWVWTSGVRPREVTLAINLLDLRAKHLDCGEDRHAINVHSSESNVLRVWRPRGRRNYGDFRRTCASGE